MCENSNARYKLLHKIGEGVHGIVLKAQDTVTDRIVAIKKVSLRTKYGEVSLSTIREIKALQHCDCEHVSWMRPSSSSPDFAWHQIDRLDDWFLLLQIMPLLDVFPDMTGLSLVFEFVPYTLYTKLKDNSMSLSRATIRSYTRMLLSGTEYMHANQIIHRVCIHFVCFVCVLTDGSCFGDDFASLQMRPMCTSAKGCEKSTSVLSVCQAHLLIWVYWSLGIFDISVSRYFRQSPCSIFLFCPIRIIVQVKHSPYQSDKCLARIHQTKPLIYTYNSHRDYVYNPHSLSLSLTHTHGRAHAHRILNRQIC